MSRRASRSYVTLNLLCVYVLSNLPTPLYVVYQKELGFSQLVLTLIYASYVVGSITAMFFLGRLSDQLGRRPVVAVATACAAASAVLFLVATSTVWLFAARIVSGLAIALVTGASAAWLLELDDRGDRGAATRLAIIGNLLGLGVGPILGGTLAAWAPWPLRLSYLVFLALLVPTAVLAMRADETVGERTRLRGLSLAPRLGVPREIRKQFAAPALGAFAMFAVLGFYSALLPSIVRDALGIRSIAVAGAIVGETFIAGTITVAIAQRMAVKRWLVVALALVVPSLALLVIAQLAGSLAILVIASAVTGVATGIGYRTCLQIVNEIAPDDRRSEVVSAFVIVCYISISIPVIGVALLAQLAGAATAAVTFAGLVAALDIAALVIELELAH